MAELALSPIKSSPKALIAGLMFFLAQDGGALGALAAADMLQALPDETTLERVSDDSLHLRRTACGWV